MALKTVEELLVRILWRVGTPADRRELRHDHLYLTEGLSKESALYFMGHETEMPRDVNKRLAIFAEVILTQLIPQLRLEFPERGFWIGTQKQLLNELGLRNLLPNGYREAPKKLRVNFAAVLRRKKEHPDFDRVVRLWYRRVTHGNSVVVVFLHDVTDELEQQALKATGFDLTP